MLARTHCLALAVVAVLSLGGWTSSDEKSLLPKVKVGDAFVYDYTSEVSAGGRQQEFNAEYHISITSLEPTGTIAFKFDARNALIGADGKYAEVPDSSNITVFKLNGEVVSNEPALASAEQRRFGRAMQIVVPDKPVDVGGTWTWSSPASEAFGRIGLEGKGELLAFEKRRDVETAKLSLSAWETSGDTPTKSTMTVWVSLADGLPVETQMTVENAPFAPGVAGSIKASNKRRTAA